MPKNPSNRQDQCRPINEDLLRKGQRTAFAATAATFALALMKLSVGWIFDSLRKGLLYAK
jgi:hypothetical protein